MGNVHWSDELKLNIESIDEEHKKLFKMINFFLSMYKVGMSGKSIVKYVDDLTTHAHLYFAEEEEEMVKQEYPLLNQQVNKHRDMKEKLKDLKSMCKSEKMEMISPLTYEISVKLINEHLYKDDMAFVDFHNRKDAFEDNSLEGCHCDIHSLDNRFLGKGKIEEINVEKSQIHITSNGNIPIKAEISEAVKVTINNKPGSSQVWIARVFNVSKIEISLFAPKILAKENRRQYLRVHTKITGQVSCKEQQAQGIIHNISLGGVLLETELDCSIGDNIEINLNLLDKEVSLQAEIVREAGKNQSKSLYGCSIKDLASGQQDQVSEFIFVNQRHV